MARNEEVAPSLEYAGQVIRQDCDKIAYKGTFGQIAVRRVDDKEKLLANLTELDRENLIRVFVDHKVEDYLLAMDLCHCTLEEYVTHHCHVDMTPKKVFLQISDGVLYLHDKRSLVHGNLHQRSIFFYNANPGVDDWKVKISEVKKSGKTKMEDIHDLASVFFYVLSCGDSLSDCMKKNWKRQGKTLNIEEKDAYGAEMLIRSMVNTNPTERISVAAVRKHPFFWSGAKTVDFFQRVHSYLKDDDELANELNKYFKEVVGDETKHWIERIPQKYEELHKVLEKRGYKKRKELRWLLCCIRHLSAHYYDSETSAALRKEIGTLPIHFADFFKKLYPKLLSVVYQFFESNKGEVAFRDFYNVSKEDLKSDSDKVPASKDDTPTSPKECVVVFCRARECVYRIDPAVICKRVEKAKRKRGIEDKQVHTPVQMTKRQIKDTYRLGYDNTLTVVAVGCRIYAFAWARQIFEVNLSDKEPYWREKAAKMKFLHGRYPPIALIKGDADGSDRVYICGGGWRKGVKNELLGCRLPLESKKCEVFDTANGSLVELPDLREACRQNSLVALEGVLYSFGGASSNEPLLNRIESYDTKTGAEWMSAGKLKTSRRNAASVAFNGKIYILGGEVEEPIARIPECEVYDPKEKQCTILTKTKPFTLRRRSTACVIGSNICLVGRISGSKSFETNMWMAVLEEDEWFEIPLNAQVEPICAVAVV